MALAEPTSLARVHLLLLRHAERLGMARKEVLRLAGMNEHDVEDPDARLPLSNSLRLWRILIDRVPDESLGIHVIEGVKLREFGLVGYSMAFSPHLLEALRRFARYVRILSESFQFNVREGKRLEVTVEGSPRFTALRHPLDASLAILVMAAREATGVRVVPVEVWFPYQQPSRLDEHRRFFGCPLEFEKSEAKIVLSDEDVQLRATAGDQTLSRYLDVLAEDSLGKLDQSDSLTTRLRRVLWYRLGGGRPSLRDSASALHISDRSMQRVLRREGTSFSTVLDELRRDTAVRMLEDGGHAINEVAFFLGYSEPSAFCRAFRQWTGVSPREFRRHAAATSPSRPAESRRRR